MPPEQRVAWPAGGTEKKGLLMVTAESRMLGTVFQSRSWCCYCWPQELMSAHSHGLNCATSSQWAGMKPALLIPKQLPQGVAPEVGSSSACSAVVRWWRGSGPGWSHTGWGWMRYSTWRQSKAKLDKRQATTPRLHTAHWAWLGAWPPLPPLGQTGTKTPRSSLRCNAMSDGQTPMRWATCCHRLSWGWWQSAWRLTTMGRCQWCSKHWWWENCCCSFLLSPTGESQPWCQFPIINKPAPVGLLYAPLNVTDLTVPNKSFQFRKPLTFLLRSCHPTLYLLSLIALFSMNQYLHLLLVGIHPGALGSLPLPQFQSSLHFHQRFPAWSTAKCQNEPFSCWQRVLKQHVTMMTATGGGHRER